MVLNNIRALRAAIVYCIPRITIMRDDALGDSGHFLIGDEVFESCCSMLRELKSALDSAPVRNCDVGTPEEQAERFKAFCLPRVGQCSNTSTCPAHHPVNQFGIQYCQLRWAQLPYEAPATPENGGEE